VLLCRRHSQLLVFVEQLPYWAPSQTAWRPNVGSCSHALSMEPIERGSSSILRIQSSPGSKITVETKYSKLRTHSPTRRAGQREEGRLQVSGQRLGMRGRGIASLDGLPVINFGEAREIVKRQLSRRKFFRHFAGFGDCKPSPGITAILSSAADQYDSHNLRGLDV
jgi:hypothetical protein